MWAHKLSCEAYQDLLDRGWRRSGQWVYRPLPDKEAACRCHPYTIRLDANKFQPSKVQPSQARGVLALVSSWDMLAFLFGLRTATCQGDDVIRFAACLIVPSQCAGSAEGAAALRGVPGG